MMYGYISSCLIVWGDFILKASASATATTCLFLDRLQFTIQEFNLLLLLINSLIELFNEIFCEAKFNFEIGDSFFGHIQKLSYSEMSSKRPSSISDLGLTQKS